MRRVLACVVLAAWTAVAAAALPAPGSPLVSRTFHLKYRPLDEAAQLAQSLLSAKGNLTVYPGRRALTVQDTPSVIDLVSHVFREYDRPDPVFRVRATLIEASNATEGNGEGASGDVDPRVRRMFPFKAYRRLGAAVLEWDAPGPISAALGEGFVLEGQAAWSRLRTGTPAAPGSENATPSMTAEDLRSAWKFGGADMVVSMLRHRRLVIEDLVLRRTPPGKVGAEGRILLRTRVVLAPNQEVVLAMSPSEDAERAVIIVLRALPPRRVEGR